MNKNSTPPPAVPLERYRKTRRISWPRLSEADKKIVMHWLRAVDATYVQNLIRIADTFGGTVEAFELTEPFWQWLEDVRAWQRDRDRGIERERPAVQQVAA